MRPDRAAAGGTFRRLSHDAVSLTFEETNALPRIYADDKKLSQILRNFISNALKFTTEGEVKAARGMGLGLSLAKKFAVLLGGTFAVTSKVGQGSRFSVRIPTRYAG